MPNPCPACGLDMDFVGRAHNCRPRPAAPETLAEIERIRTKLVSPPGAKVPTLKAEAIAAARAKVERLTPHPDCPVCAKRKAKTAELMRKRRAKVKK